MLSSRSGRRTQGGLRASFRLAAAAVLAITLLLAIAGPASATWSIVATDQDTGEVGAAIASCVPGEVLGDLDKPLVPVVLAPGTSAAVTQAQLNLDAPARIAELTAAGSTPAEIVEGLIDEAFDDLAPLRQHAVAATTGEVAAYTGAETNAVALDAQGDAVSVQGNLLVAPAVVDDALASFEASRTAGQSLGDALVAALDAGSLAGGDSRCDEQTALFAQVVVASPGDEANAPSTIITVVVDEGDGQNPVALLTSAYANGDRGVVEAGQGSTGSNVFTIVVLALAAAMIVGGILVVRRGIGSVRARR